MAMVEKKNSEENKNKNIESSSHSQPRTHTKASFTIWPLVEALELLLGHLPAEHHLTDRLRRLHQTKKNQAKQAKSPSLSNGNDSGEDGGGPGAAGGWAAASSWASASGHVSRSAVDVWDFLTGAGLSISPSPATTLLSPSLSS